MERERVGARLFAQIVKTLRLSRGAVYFTLAFVLVACASPMSLSTSPSASVSSVVQNAQTIGELTASSMALRYANTAPNCNSPTTPSAPAFLCTGVMARGTTTSSAFDPWNNSDFSKQTGAVSFFYLRADTKFSSTPSANGFVFYPVLMRPADKSWQEVMCYFPVNASTNSRPAVGGFGCGANAQNTPSSRPCREIGVTTAEGWLANGSSGSNSCSFNVRDALDAEAVAAFNQGLRVRSISSSFFGTNNEVRIGVWPDFTPKTVPIEAFFYTGSAASLNNARIDQAKFYDRTGGMFVPIIRLTLPTTASQNATFVYQAGDQNPEVLPLPAVEPVHGDEIRLGDLNPGGLKVIIHGWPSMKAGQTIWLRPQGFDTQGKEHNYTTWQFPDAVTEADVVRRYLEVTIPYSYLKDLGDGSRLTLTFRFAPEGGSDEGSARRFPDRVLTVRR